MKIAVIGSGISGNVVASRLYREHDVTMFEAASYVGGHTNTVDVDTEHGALPIDTGFIVFNDRNYPQFSALLYELGQATRPTIMSFSVRADSGDFEYNGASLDKLFAQRRNLFRPSFYRMLRDILRFNRYAIDDAATAGPMLTVGEYLEREGYSQAFSFRYLVPMAAAIWSARPAKVKEMPLAFLVRFFEHHGLLGLRNRPQWRTVCGGSREYVARLTGGFRHRIRLATPVRYLRRTPQGVRLKVDSAEEIRFDHVFVATHSDQALALLADPSVAERQVLGAIPYQRNEAILHTDETLMPRRRRTWAAWNYHLPAESDGEVAVTYNMNLLQGLSASKQYCVTLNRCRHIEPGKVIRRISYEHPVFTRESTVARERQAEINRGRTHFCGAYWGDGFHEDGVVSGLAAIRHFEEALTREELHFRRTG
jgi:predicted NAD/FAD-binding protein